MTTPTRPSNWTTDDWATPQPFVDHLARTFGRFHLDPCATKQTAKAPNVYTKPQDGLRRRWYGRVFLNPPYSDVAPWVQKAAESVQATGPCSLVVALLPPCLDTAWFHDWVLPFAELHFVRGRVSFLKGTEPGGSPRQPNLIAVYRRGGLRQDYTSMTFDAKWEPRIDVIARHEIVPAPKNLRLKPPNLF